MDPNQDIFEELDTALIEIFHRNHSIHDNINNLPHHERQRVRDEMADLLRQNSLNASSSRHHRTIRRFYEVMWYYNYIPIFTIRFGRIGQQITWHNLQQVIFDAASYFFKMIQTGLRSLIFVWVLQTHLRNITNMIFIFSNAITFSTNFIKDLFTYAFQNSPQVLHDHQLLVAHNWDVFYYFNSEEYQNASFLQHLWFIYRNYRASLLKTTCITINKELPDCSLVMDSLVYRMLDAIARSCPQLSTNMVRFITLTIFLLYATLGNFICINVLCFAMFNIMRRIIGYSKIVKNLGKVIGSTFIDYIA